MVAQKPFSTRAYNVQQLEQYLDYVHFPKSERPKPGTDLSSSEEGLAFLNKLIKFQLHYIPFENLDLIFFPERDISIDIQDLFQKFVGDGKGRGGYCHQNNSFFAAVLRGFGYDTTSVGGRVSLAASSVGKISGDAGFRGWGHYANIVRICDKPYVVDVGFGNNAPTFAVPLEEGFTGRITGDSRGGSICKLHREPVSQDGRTTADQMMWVYSVRFKEGMPWIPCYCFLELEFSTEDFEVLNFYVSKNPKSWFRNNLVCSRDIMDEETGEVVGDVTVFGDHVKERRYGKSTIIDKIEGEEQKIAAAKKYVGITVC